MKKEDKIRKIIHIDMDAFFAAVEIRDNPEYKGKPIIVGGAPNSRGVVSTCSYEARKFGIHSAMPSSKAHRLCPQAIFVKPHFEAYRLASQQIRKIFFEYTDLVEPMSMDEAYLDVTNNKKNIPSATEIAIEIKQKILETTKLTASAGVSYNKFLAKIASDFDKPDGLVVITPKDAEKVLENLPIGKFHGIGKVSEQKMQKIGIRNGADLKKWSLKDLVKHFGKMGEFYYYVVQGIDNRQVQPNWIRKSLGHERTFSEDISDLKRLTEFLKISSSKISERMIKEKFKSRTLTLKIKYDNFDLITKSKTFSISFDKENEIFSIACELLHQSVNGKNKIRLLGLSVSNLIWENDKNDNQLLLPFYP